MTNYKKNPAVGQAIEKTVCCLLNAENIINTPFMTAVNSIHNLMVSLAESRANV